MQEFFKDIFQYHHHFNQILISELEKNAGQLPAKTFPLFCHVLNAHQIWNARINEAETTGVTDVHTIEECKKMDQDNYRETISILENKSLGASVHYKNSKGQPFHNTVMEILFHASNHATHHKGQILSDFRQAGIPPVITDYIFYKR